MLLGTRGETDVGRAPRPSSSQSTIGAKRVWMH